MRKTRWGYGTLSSESTGTLGDNNMTAKSSVGDTAGAVPVNADNGNRETSAEDDRIAVTFEQKGRRPAGTQDKSCQIVQAANAANQAIGMETLYIGAASTDANIPISLGIPAITVAGEEKAVESIPSTNGTNLQNPGKDHKGFAFASGTVWI